MKIISQTSDEMVLKDGNSIPMVVGAVFFITGLVVAYAGFLGGITNGWGVGIVGIIFALVGTLLVVLISKTIVVINKPQGTVTVTKKSVAKKSDTVIKISDIVRIDLREHIEHRVVSSNNGRSRRTESILMHQAMLVLKNGSEIPLETTQGTIVNHFSTTAGQDSAARVVTSKIAEFIGIPFQGTSVDPSAAIPQQSPSQI